MSLTVAGLFPTRAFISPFGAMPQRSVRINNLLDYYLDTDLSLGTWKTFSYAIEVPTGREIVFTVYKFHTIGNKGFPMFREIFHLSMKKSVYKNKNNSITF